MLRTCAFLLAVCAAATLDWSAPAHAASPASSEQRLGRITIRSVGHGSPIVLIPSLASPAALDNLIPSAVDELAGWLDANHVEKPAVIGHAMGGLMTLMVGKRHPAAAGKLMIVDALPFYGMLFGPTATPEAVRPIVEQMRAGLVNGTSPAQVPPHMSNTDAGKAMILAWLKTSDPNTVGQALVEDATTDVRPGLRQSTNR